MRNLIFATALTAALGTAAPTLVHAAPTTNLPAERAPADVRSAEAPAASTDADEASYAAAEAQNPDAANFTGGSTVIFIGSTTAMVLAIVLLLVIL